MREIKFRGMTLENNKMVYGDLLLYRVLPVIFDEDKEQHEVKANTVGQFTGLQDKNGKDIYENDIVKYSLGPANESCRIVRFGEFLVDCSGQEYPPCKGTGFYFERGNQYDEISFDCTIEIIGNKFENEGLWEEVKNA